MEREKNVNTSKMYRAEPIYENVQKDIENVQEIDERLINFLHIVKQAPHDIQISTDKFLASLDKLKKNYIVNIVKSKKVESKYNAVQRYVTLCQREYNFHKFQDDYLNQVSPELHQAAVEKLEKAKLECSMRYCQLQLAVRELELSKEKLCRLSKRAEHLFLSTLRSHPDRAWAHIYKNDSQRPKSELKRVRTIPAVLPKPGLKARRDEARLGMMPCNECMKGRRSSTESIHTGQRTGKYLVKTHSLDEDSCSSDEEFPPPPPPLSSTNTLKVHERIVVVDVIDRKNKRLSDRSAVDEGIGDIDWKPTNLTTSEDGIAETELVNELDRITQLIDTIDHTEPNFLKLIDEELPAAEITNNTDTILDDLPEVPHEVNTGSESILPEVLTSDDSNVILPVDEIYVNTELSIPTINVIGTDAKMPANDDALESDVYLDTKLTRVQNDRQMSQMDDRQMSQMVDDRQITQMDDRQMTHMDDRQMTQMDNRQMTQMDDRQMTQMDNRQMTQMDDRQMPQMDNRQMSQMDDRLEHIYKHNHIHEKNRSIETNKLRKITESNITFEEVSDTCNDTEVTNVPDGNEMTQRDEREEHVYEDVTQLQHYKQKNEKRKKSKLQFLTKVFHGPWEGWEEK